MRPSSNFVASTIGIASLILVLFVPSPGQLPTEAWYTAGIAVAMAAFWIGQVLPLAVTALLPLLLAPLLGIAPIKDVGAQYGHPIIFLFFGGFVLGLAMERWQLHRRIALTVVLWFGDNERKQLAGFMLVTAFLSMWVSNTATAIMMLPIAMSVIGLNPHSPESSGAAKLARPLLLGIAYAASIGGLATLIGTPPNALMAAYLQEQHQVAVSFVGWMAIAVPLCLILLAISWFWLGRGLAFAPKATTLSSESRRRALQQQLEQLGPITAMEKRVALVFVITATCWVLRPVLDTLMPLGRLSDTTIALAAALALHILPAGDAKGSKLMDWPTTQKMPWDVLLLFGGGLALASLMSSSGLAGALADSLQNAEAWPTWLLVFLVVGLVIFLTEVTSNTATAAVFLPLLGSLALAMGLAPETVVMPAAIAASCAFMLPVATPPNAIVFGSGQLKVADMAKAGLGINLMAWVLITVWAHLLI